MFFINCCELIETILPVISHREALRSIHLLCIFISKRRYLKAPTAVWTYPDANTVLQTMSIFHCHFVFLIYVMPFFVKLLKKTRETYCQCRCVMVYFISTTATGTEMVDVGGWKQTGEDIFTRGVALIGQWTPHSEAVVSLEVAPDKSNVKKIQKYLL